MCKEQPWYHRDAVSAFGSRNLNAFIVKLKPVFLLQMEVQPVGKGGMGV
jgi:hypothetical protein